MKLSIVVPAHNEEENISDLIIKIEELLDLPFELVIVNDHSLDHTEDIVKRLANSYNNIKLVANEMPNGFANAIRTGFMHASGDAVLPLMADLCDDLQTIKPMYEKMGEGVDIVCGSRYIQGGLRLGGSKLKGFLSCFAGRSLRYLLGVPTSDIANAFKMYRKEVLDGITLEAKGFEISMEIPIKAYLEGFKIAEVPTVWRERSRGKSSFKIFKFIPGYLKLYFWAIYKRIKHGKK
ncbi:MAG: glycosyltransferase family 2 protein [Candidatus Omnitrophota bacterium]